ncbi:hypothetical protein AVDCRST_MAG94-7206, partial [uncultured Leptolyngbya sp.]
PFQRDVLAMLASSLVAKRDGQLQNQVHLFQQA